jgi:hypothetical protein
VTGNVASSLALRPLVPFAPNKTLMLQDSCLGTYYNDDVSDCRSCVRFGSPLFQLQVRTKKQRRRGFGGLLLRPHLTCLLRKIKVYARSAHNNTWACEWLSRELWRCWEDRSEISALKACVDIDKEHVEVPEIRDVNHPRV